MKVAGMKPWEVIIIPVLFFATTSAHADGVFLEGGLGFQFSTDSQAMFLNYHIDSSPIFGLESFYDLELGSWNGQNHNDAIILAKGMWWDLPKNTYFSFEPGGAYMVKTSNNLGTHLQFAFRFALGMRTEKIDFSIGYRHFSNGAKVFHWTDPSNNNGENFITLQIGYLL